MRTISLTLLSALKLSWTLTCLAIQDLELPQPPAQATRTLRTLDDTGNFRPRSFPGTRQKSLLAVFSSPTSRYPTSLTAFELASLVENSPDIATAHTPSVQSMSDASDYSSPSSWAAPKFFTDLSAFNITHFANGRDNLEVVAGVTLGVQDTTLVEDSSSCAIPVRTNASVMLQLFYPEGSINPAGWPRGGSQFYASPLDVSDASSLTFEYKVFFPSDFDWVKGGKLPGLYGGRTGCSGGDAALDCFSTRLMWRAGGAGELYLYAPKNRQTRSLCSAPPQSVCDSTFGLSIARGSFEFSRGAWTHVRQTVVLNSPGVQDGGFLLEVNGDRVIDRGDVLYRDKPRGPDFVSTPSYDPDSRLGRKRGLLGSLLGGLIKSRLRLRGEDTQEPSSQTSSDSSSGFVPSVPCDAAGANAQTDPLSQQTTLENNDDKCIDDYPRADATQETGDTVGFQGVFFSTFFGGHNQEFATPKDQFVWFKDFALYINDP